MLRFFARALSLLPFPILYFLSDSLRPVVSGVYRRKVVLKNLKRVFPLKGEKEISQIANSFYSHFLDISLETLKTLSMSADEFERRVKFEKDDVFHEIIENKEASLIFTSHYCNWEWLAVQGGQELGDVLLLYKALHKQSSDQLMASIRGRFGNKLISTKRVREIVKSKNEYDALAIIADQTPTKSNQAKVWATFLGQETAFYQGVFTIPYLTQLPAYYVSMRRVSRGFYVARFEKMGSPPYKKEDYNLLQSYIGFSERDILSNPSNWLWSHKRWKYKRQPEELKVDF